MIVNNLEHSSEATKTLREFMFVNNFIQKAVNATKFKTVNLCAGM